MHDTIALNKLRREWEADRLPLPQYLAGVQRLVAVEIERKQRAERSARAQAQADKLVLMLMPLAGLAFIALTIFSVATHH
jgi:hypothetical protein